MAAFENEPADDPERHLPGWLARLAALQAMRPWLLVIIATVSLLPTAWAASRLELKMDLSELLPDSKESVIEMRRASKRLAGNATLSIIVHAPAAGHSKEIEGFVDALVPET